MNINMTVMGQFMAVFMLVVAALSYLLGKRKTHSPMIATAVGVLLALLPPLALIYLLVLALKKDVKKPPQQTR
ncbi:hypothetical protein [Pseudidiomarina insulisalsae]|uniref:Uncharacterized protein n=1 Tax=Pseudidiomarina insulisalsae TaxID=575789 RepID=A0A432YCK2_9GAMM|nr:hypothetical protein [Pseudidiomarina insulisalsae]RUO58730.1 hypothetical protein CWI71_09925 [Pseudidiomarina insulisalsae]